MFKIFFGVFKDTKENLFEKMLYHSPKMLTRIL